MPESVTVTYTDQSSQRRRVTFDRREPGGWDYSEERLEDGEWQPVGHEVAADLEVEIGAGAVDVIDVIRSTGGPAMEVNTGP